MTIEEEKVRLGFLILRKIIQFPQNSYRGQIFVYLTDNGIIRREEIKYQLIAIIFCHN